MSRLKGTCPLCGALLLRSGCMQTRAIRPAATAAMSGNLQGWGVHGDESFSWRDRGSIRPDKGKKQ